MIEGNEMSNKYKSLAKDTVIFSLGNIGSKLVLFLLLPIYTNFLSTSEYGLIELIDTAKQIIIPIVSVSICNSVIRFGFAKDERREDVFICGLLITCAGSFLLLMMMPLFKAYKTISLWVDYLVVYALLDMYYQLAHNYLKVANKNLFFAFVSVIQTSICALSNIVFLVYLKLGIKGYFYALYISYVICLFICICNRDTLISVKQGKIKTDLLKRMTKYSVPLIASNLSWWVIHSSDKVMLEIMVSTATVGIYTVASKIPSLINVLSSIFQQSWSIAAIKETESQNEEKFFSNVLFYLQTFIFGAVICIISIIKPFMGIYVGKDFYSSWKYVPMLLLASSFNVLSVFWGSIYSAIKKTLNSMITVLIASIVNLIVNYIFIPKYGIWGAVFGTVTSYFVILIIRMIDCKKYISINLSLKSFFLNCFLAINLAVFVSFSTNNRTWLLSLLTIIVYFILNFKVLRNMIKFGLNNFGLIKKRREY